MGRVGLGVEVAKAFRVDVNGAKSPMDPIDIDGHDDLAKADMKLAIGQT